MAFDIIRDTLPGITSIFLRKDIHFIFPIALSFLENTNKILDSGILILLCIPVIIYTLTNLHLQFSRILFFLYYFISKGFWFSSSRYSHQYLPHIWVLICLSISPDWGSELEKKVHRFVYRACLISISIFYFYPGAWKLFLGIQQGALAKIDYGANTIAFYLESHGKGS